LSQEKLILADSDPAAVAEDVCSGEVLVPITLANANAMAQAGGEFIAASKSPSVQLDMTKVAANTVAVAVTLAWLGQAQSHDKELCLGNLSADFSGVIEFSGISSIFSEHITQNAPSGDAL